MKILILADSMDIGGAETHVYELSRSLLSRGQEPILLSAGGATARRLEEEGVRHITPRHRGMLSYFFTLFRAIWREKPDILHAHTRKSAVMCRVLSPLFRVPTVFSAHARFRAGGAGELIRLHRGQSIAVSRDLAAHMEKTFGFAEERITVIHNGIDTDRFAPAPCDESSICRLLTVSRLDRDCARAASLLLDILPALAARFPVTLTIVGGGDALPHIREKAAAVEKRLGRKCVLLAGKQEDVRPYMAGHDLFIGVSRAALEAMSMEKPVILCGDEGYLGQLDKGTLARATRSNFCCRGDGDATADALLRDITALWQMDAEKRRDRGRWGREVILGDHSSRAMTEKTLAVYRRAWRESRKHDIFLCGYYGFGNVGDDLVLRALVREIRKAVPNIRLAVLTKKRMTWAGLDAIPRRPLAIRRAIRTSGVLLLGGGTLLQTATSRRSLYYYLSLLLGARRAGVRYGMLLGGAGPIAREKDRRVLARVMADAFFVGVRDTRSLAFLSDLGVREDLLHAGADPVFSLPLPEVPKSPCHMAVFPYGGENAAFMEGVVQAAVRAGGAVLVGAMDAHRDGGAVEALIKHLRARGLPVSRADFADTDALCRLIAASRLVITARLHAAILAICLGVPVLGVGDDPKMRGMFEEAYGGSLSKYLCLPTRATPSLFAARAAFALENAPKILAESARRRADLCRRSARQIAILVEKAGFSTKSH